MSIEGLIAGGGGAGALAVIAYSVKMWLDHRRDKRAGDTAAEMTPVANAATANEILVATLQEVRQDRADVRGRLDEVEQALIVTRDEARRERLKREAQARRLDEHDREIGHIKRQFSLAVSYIRSLLAFITDQGLTDEAPKPPSGLNLD